MPTLSQGQIEMVARSAGLPGDPKVWAAVAMAESSGRTDVVNSIGCVGLWQINQPVHVKSHPQWTVKWLQNPMNNAQAAKVIYRAQGWAAWEAYTGPDGKGSDGPWRRYMKGGGGSNTSADQAFDPFDPFGILPEGSTDLLHETPGFKQFGDIATGVAAGAEAIQKAGEWMSDSRNWVRVGYVVGGAILVIVGLNIVAAPLLGKAASSTPAGKAIGKVAGSVKTKVKAARSKKKDAEEEKSKPPEGKKPEREKRQPAEGSRKAAEKRNNRPAQRAEPE